MLTRRLTPPPELLKTYRKTKDWAAYQAAFLEEERGVPEKADTGFWVPKLALLCSEPGPEKCHRRLVAELLAKHWLARGDQVEIRHLILERTAKAASGRKKAAPAR